MSLVQKGGFLYMYSEEIEMYLDEFKENMTKVVNHLADELLQIRAGRANPKMIERIMVDYYGTMTPIVQMATISVPEPRMIMVNAWDVSMVKAISKAIENANLGLNPSDDGRSVRLIFPQLTQERRKELAKEVNKLVEQSKIPCRNARREVLDAFKDMKKDGSITEDDFDRLEKEVQKLLDDNVSKIESLGQSKEKEIMEI